MQFVIIAALVSVVFFFIAFFNRLVKLRFLMKEAWSGIDVQLKKRHDLIPNIVEAVKGYTAYEQKVFTEVTNLRTTAVTDTANVREKSEAENEFSRGLKNIFALMEAYPDLKANKSFLDLQRALIEIEDALQMARRYYNGTVRNFNTAVETFPSNLIASFFNFKAADFFEIEYASERRVPDVKI